ncbi:unnamed protein product [Pocillopora meandrina]|uniref:Uncharacterized protein n=1 Tax=Pocillopora meandrina TaxID=46732 RepID=A0AAU9W829_9CNID|nr:unnamed protein product [Pocillopora meandrina]
MSYNNDFEDILGDDREFFSAVRGDFEGNTSDESNSSHTDGSESESDRNCSGSDCSDDEDPEVWHEDMWQMMNLCQNQSDASSTQTLITLFQWFIYFLLFWQATCKISDNGLERLLHFMFQFLHVMGINCISE